MRINKHLEAPVAHGGALLSRACVRFPGLIGRHVVGEASGNFTPLPYRVARTRLSELDERLVAEYAGNPYAGSSRKDYCTAGVSRIPMDALLSNANLPKRLRAIAVIGWAVGGHLLVAPIPSEELDLSAEEYSVAMRIGPGTLQVVAGVLDKRNELYAGPITAGAVLPVGEIPPEIPLH